VTTDLEIERIFREEHGRVVASLIRRFGDIDVAEDAAAEALLAAVERWSVDGVPPNPGGWLTTTAVRKGIDKIRRESHRDAKYQQALMIADDTPHAPTGPVEDDRLRLIFTCCHPALAPEARVALTLRLLGGLTVPEIASAFLVSETTMGQRITRAKKKIAAANIPYRVPSAEDLPGRLTGVLAVLYLVFNEGYNASSGEEPVRHELCEEAIRLARILASLLPGEPEPAGLLALMLFHHSRAAARHGDDGLPVLLDDQDRSLWDPDVIGEGEAALRDAAGAGWVGIYCLQAAIAREHVRAAAAADTDWPAIVALYDDLAAVAPSPVVDLNRAVAVSMSEGPGEGLVLVDRLADDPALAAYHLLPAARADMLRRLGRDAEALAEYRRALELAPGAADRAFLSRRCAELSTI